MFTEGTFTPKFRYKIWIYVVVVLCNLDDEKEKTQIVCTLYIVYALGRDYQSIRDYQFNSAIQPIIYSVLNL